jgi:murein L,D-transpeptidase YcbB/YkuD
MPCGRICSRLILAVAAGLAVLALLTVVGAAREPEIRPVCERACELLRNRVEAAGFPPRLLVGKEAIFASDILPLFYEQRGYRLAWSGNGGPLPQVDDLVSSVRLADRDGLRPADYHLKRIEGLLGSFSGPGRVARPIDPRLLVDLDLLLTDAFLTYGFHLLHGRLDSESIDPEWHIASAEEDLSSLLQDAVSWNRVSEDLNGLRPSVPCYQALKDARVGYRRLAAAGGWPEVPAGGKLEKGAHGSRVGVLRERLEASGDLATDEAEGDVFDEILEDAVVRFQRRQGLEADGVVGPKTLAALNETVEQRLRQIEVNMERWRWLPRSLGDRFIRVNIADFVLDVFEADEHIMTMRVIVGRDYRRTPVFSDLMTYLVINPYWNVPRKLTVQDKLPLIKADPGYLADQKMRVFSGWGVDAVEIDPSTVDWSKVTADNFTWRLRQDPGPKNALGRIKFMFPNKFDIYLHDTPSRELFEQPVRAASSGCIRLEKPVDLAEYLLRGYPQWTRPAILAAIDKGEERTVRLLEPIPVYIIYCTAWVDEDTGEINFRPDIYGRDRAVADALMSLPPTPEEIMALDEREPGDGER